MLKQTGVGDHCNATGHSVPMDSLKVIDREQDWMKRKVKEAIYIKQRAPSITTKFKNFQIRKYMLYKYRE